VEGKRGKNYGEEKLKLRKSIISHAVNYFGGWGGADID
jgi:hypothetical protein